MRFVFDEVSPGHWLWHLYWGDRHVADATQSYGSLSAAETAARAFQRAVERAGRRAPATV